MAAPAAPIAIVTNARGQGKWAVAHFAILHLDLFVKFIFVSSVGVNCVSPFFVCLLVCVRQWQYIHRICKNRQVKARN